MHAAGVGRICSTDSVLHPTNGIELAALLATAERYDLWRLAETSPSAFTLPGVDASRDLIGVRVHDDLGPLLRAIAHDGAVVDE